MRHGKTRPDRLRGVERRALVFALRKNGATYQVILQAVRQRYGATLPRSYDRRRVAQEVQQELKTLQADLTEDALAVREMELQRLDELQVGIWAAARAGNLEAVNTVLRIMARRARLLMLDGPIHIAHTTPGGQQEAGTSTGLTDDELAAVLSLRQPHQGPEEG